MGKRRFISTCFWDDNTIILLSTIEKLLFLYFLTNPLTNVAWIYEISLKRINSDTCIEIHTIKEIMKKFEDLWKIRYIDGWLYIKNFSKHQNLDNIKISQWIALGWKVVPQNVKNKIWLLKTLDDSSMSLDDSRWLSNNLDSDSDIDYDIDSDQIFPKPLSSEEFQKQMAEKKSKDDWIRKNKIIDSRWNALLKIWNETMNRKDFMDDGSKKSFMNFIDAVNSNEEFTERIDLFKKAYDLTVKHSLEKFFYRQIQTFSRAEFLKQINTFTWTLYDVMDKLTTKEYKNKVKRIIEKEYPLNLIEEQELEIKREIRTITNQEWGVIQVTLTSTSPIKQEYTEEQIKQQKKDLLSKLKPSLWNTH